MNTDQKIELLIKAIIEFNDIGCLCNATVTKLYSMIEENQVIHDQNIGIELFVR